VASTVPNQRVAAVAKQASSKAADAQAASMAVGEQASALPVDQWPVWEVFTQSEQGAPHEHAGSLHAVDAEQALQNARDVYARRGGVISLWVIPSGAITASSPGEAGPFFDPGADKAYRHPQFYKVPRGVRGV
jgi:ring-1,2-phenylacetyl-CoA epoxidase subunit PaaB